MSTLAETYELIHSLSSAELRYVSWQLSARKRNGEKNSVSLFQAIVKTRPFDEKAILKAASGQGSIARFPSAAIGRLRDTVLKALRSYREESSIELKLRNMLEEDSILQERLLHRTREKMLRKLVLEARQYELWDIYLEGLDRLLYWTLEHSNSESAMAELLDEQQRAYTLQVTYLQLNNLFLRLFFLYRSSKATAVEEIMQLDAAFKKVHWRLEGEQEWFSIEQIHLKFLAMLATVRGDYTKAFQYRHEIKELWARHPLMQSYRPTAYKMALSNYLNSAYRISNFEPVEATLQALKALPVTSEDDEGELFQNVVFLELLYYMNHDRHEEVIALVPEIEKGLIRYARKINEARKLAFCLNLASAFFNMSRYDDCLDWVNRIKAIRSYQRMDIQSMIFFLELLAHCSLGNDALLESMLRNARRRFQKEHRFSDYEATLFKHLRALLLSAGKRRQQANAELQSFLESYRDPEFQDKSFLREDILRWLKRSSQYPQRGRDPSRPRPS